MADSKKVILVVEDEPLLRLAAIDMIDGAGFEAIGVADATEAVHVLESRPDIRIVFTDIDMPRGMDGIRLAACIRERWPPIKIVVTSGRFERSETHLPEDSLFFAKPYQESEVVAAFHRLANGVP